MVDEDLQIFQNDEDFFNSVSDLQALTDILDIDIYDVCAKDGKYENVLFSLLKLKLCMFDVIFYTRIPPTVYCFLFSPKI